MTTTPRPDPDHDLTAPSPTPALEVVGDLDVGVCVDDTCGVPSLAAPEPGSRTLDPGDARD